MAAVPSDATMADRHEFAVAEGGSAVLLLLASGGGLHSHPPRVEVLDDDGSLPWGTPVEEAGSAAVPVTVVGQPAGGLAAQVGQIKEFLQLDAAMTAPVALREANAQMGLPCEGTLPEQAAALIAALGI